MLIVFIFLTFCTVGLIGYTIAPAIYGNVASVSDRRQQKFSNTMEQLLPQKEAKKISRIFVIAPLVYGNTAICFIFRISILLSK